MSPKGKMFLTFAVAALAVPAVVSAQQSYGQQPYGGQPYAPPPAGQPNYGQPDNPQTGPQSYGQGPYEQGPGAQAPGGPGYGPPMQGDQAMSRHTQPSVYPEFRPIEKHIRHQIRMAMRSNMLAPADAHGMMAQLHRIQAEEMREYQEHGLNLPPRAQARIQGELTQLAQAVDQGHGQPQ